MRSVACFLLLVSLSGCRPSAERRGPLEHEAYVWQRRWTASLSHAVREAPPELRALHVLAREWSREGAVAEVAVDLPALASAREVVAVARLDGTLAPAADALEQLADTARRWSDAGVRVRGVEIDFDCPTSRLGEYAAWLRRGRPSLGGLRLEITALPTWSSSPLRRELEEAVDAVTLQVHAVRAPVLFAPEQARRDVEAWSRDARRPFSVALPTYRARIAGQTLEADPRIVASFLGPLRTSQARAASWFRLGHAGDPDAWSPATLSAVLRGEPLTPRFAVTLVASATGALDVRVDNVGHVDAPGPARLVLRGNVELLDGAAGYHPQGPRALGTHQPPRIPAGQSLVVGFVRGSDLHLESL